MRGARAYRPTCARACLCWYPLTCAGIVAVRVCVRAGERDRARAVVR